METLSYFLNLIMHLDQHILFLVTHYGFLTYGLLFLIIFCETGLVITPVLPGDSLLFATGTLAASSTNILNIHVLFILLLTASVLGNTVNYLIGRKIGPRIFNFPKSRLLNLQHLEKAHRFYENHGGKAIIIARFLPILRTFAPFVAGIASMNLARFQFYNLVGGLLWIGGLLYTSYLFGNLSFIQDHFSTVILLIIFGSLLPVFITYMKHRLQTA